MKKFSPEEKSLTRELFVTTARCIIELWNGEFDGISLNKTLSFYDERYKDCLMKDFCKEEIVRRFFLRLANDHYNADLGNLKVYSRHTFPQEKFTLEHIWQIANCYKAYGSFSELFKAAEEEFAKIFTSPYEQREVNELKFELGCFMYHIVICDMVIDFFEQPDENKSDFLINKINELFDIPHLSDEKLDFNNIHKYSNFMWRFDDMISEDLNFSIFEKISNSLLNMAKAEAEEQTA